MDHSLFNPNQICMHGIPVWDNPFDSDRPFSIQISDNKDIPNYTWPASPRGIPLK